MLEIRLHGRPAFLKQFLGPDAQDRLDATLDQIARMAALLDEGPDALCQLLLTLPAHGVLITAAAPGQQMSHLLAAAPPQRRAALLARIAAWLRRLTGQDRHRAPFAPGFWLHRLDGRIAQVRAPIDRILVAAHMGVLREAAMKLQGAKVLRATIHGDLTPDNLFLHGARLTAIDPRPSSPLPVVRDVARLLVWLESRRDCPAPAQRDGIALADHTALSALSGLLPADQAPILRFMIGELLLDYYLASASKPDRRQALARAMRDWAIRPGP